ncbi:MAG: MmgE/PrpD family protein [Deltaproteobacteria bacterium]|nr:MmgE/PrpD family protein [Deltaproteobacteria bacterium]MBW2307357.1 MmgE/PrpD family protein [Deltaproteobacteria bacterium]
MQITRVLSEFVASASFDQLPDDVARTGKLCCLDWMAVTLAGSRQPLVEILVDLCRSLGGNEQATLVGRPERFSVLHAALVNGSASHALDYDDVHFDVIGHPTISLLPVAMALAEQNKTSGREFLLAFALGFETECRVGRAVNPDHYDKGWHATATLGTLGAAVTAARLLKLPAPAIVHALGIAGTQAGGVRQVFGSMTKPFHAGKAAMNGMLAALLAQRGFTCSTEILEGPRGFSAVLSTRQETQKITEELGRRWALPDVLLKRHASCFETHPAIDAVLALRQQHAMDPESVASLQLDLHPFCTEVANIRRPHSGLEAKFCIPHCAALALATGETGEGQFTDAVAFRDDLSRLREKITINTVPHLGIHKARIAVQMTDGAVLHAEADTLHIGRDISMKERTAVQKFQELAPPILGPRRTQQLREGILQLEELNDVSGLISLCSSPRENTSA